MQSRIGIAWMVAASLFYGTMNICVKLSGPHLTVWQTAFGRFILGVCFMPILIRLLRLEKADENAGCSSHAEFQERSLSFF